jgi:hypothetical protein
MKAIIALALVLSLGTTFASEPSKKSEGETKEVTVNGKKSEVRVPKSAKIDCKDKANADKPECKKPSKEMPKIEKPVADKK